jgi:uncharacterized membrane protein YfcA
MATFWVLVYVFIGLTVGVISGILGIGGGVLLVPILMWCGFKYRQATGTSLAVLVPPIGLPAAWKAFQDGYVDLGAAFCIASAFAVGAYYGRSVQEVLDERIFKICFGVFMIFIAMRFILSASDETTVAIAGLTAAALSLLGFGGLYMLGRRHIARPTLADRIRASREEGYTDPDYYI